MRKYEIKILMITMTLYLLNRVCKSYINIPFIGYICRCHLNDFFGGIVFMAYINLLLFNYKKIRIANLLHTILIMIICGILWEYFFPLFLPYSISDFYDVIAYVVGGIVYQLIIITITKRRNKYETDDS